MNVIIKNVKGLENTFMYELHENSIFNKELLMGLIFEIIDLVRKAQEGNLSDKSLLNSFKDLFRIYEITSSYLKCHYKPNDVYHIKDLPEDYVEYVNRLVFVMKMLLARDYDAIVKYEDEIGSLINEYEGQAKLVKQPSV